MLQQKKGSHPICALCFLSGLPLCSYTSVFLPLLQKPAFILQQIGSWIKSRYASTILHRVRTKKKGALWYRHTITMNAITQTEIEALTQHRGSQKVMDSEAHCIRAEEDAGDRCSGPKRCPTKHKLPASNNCRTCMSHLCERLNGNKRLIWPGAGSWQETDSI